jgi:hypothetical protein
VWGMNEGARWSLSEPISALGLSYAYAKLQLS